MSKYNMINVLMGRSADYNDKLKVGRSLKFMGYMSDEKFDELVIMMMMVMVMMMVMMTMTMMVMILVMVVASI